MGLVSINLESQEDYYRGQVRTPLAKASSGTIKKTAYVCMI